MINISNVVLAVCGILGSYEAFSDIVFEPIHTAKNKPFPLVVPMVAVGCDRFTEEKGEVYSKPDANGNTQLLYNRATDIRISFDVVVSQSMNGAMCYYYFNRVANYLMENDDLYNYVGAGCGNVKYQRDLGGNILHGWVDIQMRRIV